MFQFNFTATLTALLVLTSSISATGSQELYAPHDQWHTLQDIEPLNSDDTEIALKAAFLISKSPEKQLLILQALADLFHEQGRFEAEKEMLIQWINYANKIENYSPVTTATQHLRLSYAYFSLSEFEKAESEASISLKLFKQSCSKTSPNIALALNNLAWIALKRGNYSLAEANMLQSLEILSGTVGKKAFIYGLITQNLASLYSHKGEHKQSCHFYKISLKILKHYLDKEDSVITEVKRRLEEEFNLADEEKNDPAHKVDGNKKHLAGEEQQQK